MTTSIPLRVFFATSALKKRLGKRRELMERTTKVFPLDDTPKALKNQGFSGKPFQSGHSFSSQARYDHFDTSPQYNYSVFGTDNMISSQPRYDHFDTAAYSTLVFYGAYLRISDIEKKIKTFLSPAPGGKCQGLNAEKSKIIFCALFTKPILPPQPPPPGQAPSAPARHTFPQGCRAGIHLPTAGPPACRPLLSL